MPNELHEQNRRSWNQATRVHNAHKRDQAGFLRAGGSTLFPEELDLVGPFDQGRAVHLLCNSGQDTLSLARRGGDWLGVDISDEAVDFARRLSDDSGIGAEFVRSDVYDWLEAAPEAGFDLVFSSYGWLGWLSDLPAWARGVARILKPGGRFVTVEFGSVIFAIEDGRIAWPISSSEPLSIDDGVGDYVGRSEGALSPSGHQGADSPENPEKTWEFAHSELDLIKALLGAGLTLERVEQYPFSNGCDPWGTCRVDDDRRMWPPPELKGIPMMYGLSARR